LAPHSYVRIVGELRKLGISVSATLVRNVLARAGIPSAPERAGPSWRSFLREHAETVRRRRNHETFRLLRVDADQRPDLSSGFG
jgi:hypothetical protein